MGRGQFRVSGYFRRSILLGWCDQHIAGGPGIVSHRRIVSPTKPVGSFHTRGQRRRVNRGLGRPKRRTFSAHSCQTFLYMTVKAFQALVGLSHGWRARAKNPFCVAFPVAFLRNQDPSKPIIRNKAIILSPWPFPRPRRGCWPAFQAFRWLGISVRPWDADLNKSHSPDATLDPHMEGFGISNP